MALLLGISVHSGSTACDRRLPARRRARPGWGDVEPGVAADATIRHPACVEREQAEVSLLCRLGIKGASIREGRGAINPHPSRSDMIDAQDTRSSSARRKVQGCGRPVRSPTDCQGSAALTRGGYSDVASSYAGSTPEFGQADLLGLALDDLPGNLRPRLQPHLSDPLDAFRVRYAA